MIRFGRVIASGDRLFGSELGRLGGDYVVLGRYEDDDWVRPATPATDGTRLVEVATDRDDLSEPNRWEVVGTVVVDAGWRYESFPATVRTSYPCYPTGGDFTVRAQLEMENLLEWDSVGLPADYAVDGLVLFYGCCFAIGIGYARFWEGPIARYVRIRFAYANGVLQTVQLPANEAVVQIARAGGVLNLEGLIQQEYRLPERMGVMRVRFLSSDFGMAVPCAFCTDGVCAGRMACGDPPNCDDPTQCGGDGGGTYPPERTLVWRCRWITATGSYTVRVPEGVLGWVARGVPVVQGEVLYSREGPCYIKERPWWWSNALR